MSNLNNYRQQKEEKNQVHETPVDKKQRTNFKIVKVNSEIHGLLKLEAAKTGYTMQEIVEEAIMDKLGK